MVAGRSNASKGAKKIDAFRDGDLAYTPLSEKQKHEAMKKLIKNLHDPNHPAGNYRSPGGSRTNISDKH